MPYTRRDFLKFTATTTLLSGVAPRLLAETTSPLPGDFDFVFFTDAHLQPELNATSRCLACFEKINQTHADFAINGGDLVYDAAKVPRARAESLFDLYRSTEKVLTMPVRHTLGNHDLYGLAGGPEAGDPDYGKKMYQDRYGSTYYSFDHKGYHFVVLDSIAVTEDRAYETRIDPEQLRWLRNDLSGVPAGRPILVVSHAPLATGFFAYAPPLKDVGPRPTLSVVNAFEVIALLEQHHVIAVLQGHTHINEVVSYKGCAYITSGAVCGDWWNGPRWGTPEGFTVVSLRGGLLTHRYETYGPKV